MIASPLEMLMPNNDRKNSKLFPNLVISLKDKKTKMKNKTAKHSRRKKSSRQDFKGYSNCPSQSILFSLANRGGYPWSSPPVILSTRTSYLPDETISIIHQVKAFGCPVFLSNSRWVRLWRDNLICGEWSSFLMGYGLVCSCTTFASNREWMMLPQTIGNDYEWYLPKRPSWTSNYRFPPLYESRAFLWKLL